MQDTITTTTSPSLKDDSLAANINALIEQVKAGKSDTLRAYLAAMARFHSYSFGNVLEILVQRPSATRVAGYSAWKALGRQVRKGAKGIRIYAPMIGTKRSSYKGSETASGTGEDAGEKCLYGFKAVYVFAQEDTEGDDVPTISSAATGDATEHLYRLVAYSESLGIPVGFDANISPALGMSYGGRIAILPGQTDAEALSTLAHELGHELMHKNERREKTNKTIRETEAEAVAFVVCTHLGITSLDAAADYVQLYSGDAATLTESFRFIHQAAKQIVEGLEALSRSSEDPSGDISIAVPSSQAPQPTFALQLAA